MRTDNSPGVYTYEAERSVLDAENEARLKRWATPLIAKGYRFEELTQVHQQAGDSNCVRLVGLGVSSLIPVWRLRLRRQWRKVFVYGCLDIVVGGAWRFWE